jgi:spartin
VVPVIGLTFCFPRYGADAGETARHVTGTAKNVALVYIDMRGIGRKALLKRAGKQFVKARFSSSGRM